LKVRSERFRDEVFKALVVLGLRPWRYENEDRYGKWYWVFVENKSFVQFMNILKEEPRKAIQWVKGYESEFLRGFYESEGGVYVYSNRRAWFIQITNANRDYIRLVEESLASLGIKYKVKLQQDRRPNRGEYYRLIIGRHSEVMKFLSIVRPVIKNKPERC